MGLALGSKVLLEGVPWGRETASLLSFILAKYWATDKSSLEDVSKHAHLILFIALTGEICMSLQSKMSGKQNQEKCLLFVEMKCISRSANYRLCRTNPAGTLNCKGCLLKWSFAKISVACWNWVASKRTKAELLSKCIPANCRCREGRVSQKK